MKKFRHLSIVLCIVLLLQCTVFSVSAAETTADTSVQETQETVPNETAAQIPFGSVCIQNGCRTIAGQVPVGGSDRILSSAQAAFVYETETNTVVYAYNPDTKLAPGNLAKIMTALLALEMCELDDVVTASSKNISKLPAGSLNVDIKHDEQLTVKDLIYCMMLKSANDAAIALAEHISGNQDAFVSLMNARARQIGCTGTEFANVHGLDNATQYTTARDMARIVLEAMKNEDFAEAFSAIEYKVPPTNKTEKERSFRSLNYFLHNYDVSKYYNDRVKSGIVHYASASGASIACTAEYKDMKVICIVMGCVREMAENGWSVKYYGNFDEATDLLKYALEKFKVNRVIYDGQSLHQFTVSGGESNVVGQTVVNIDTVLPVDCQMDNLWMEYSPVGGGLFAPIEAGEMISTVEVWYRNSCLMEAELYAMNPVKTAADSDVTIHGLNAQTQENSGGFLKVFGIICCVILGVAALYLGLNYLRMRRIKAKRRRRRASRRRSY